ncbi:MAG: DUF3810 family protein [Clostridia bacterium]|nr:DUF3810 family protein [Clostridia bacterium]
MAFEYININIKTLKMDTRIVLDELKKPSIKRLLPALISLSVSVIFLIILLILRTNSAVCESITRNVTLKMNAWAGASSGKVSFSVFETFLIVAVALLILFVIRIIALLATKRGFFALRTLIVLFSLATLFGCYYLFTAGFAYNRALLPIYCEENPDYYEFYEAVKYFKNDYDVLSEKFARDENGSVISPYTLDELGEIFRKEYSRILGEEVFSFDCKPLKLLSGYFTKTGITGITFTPTGDCGLNVYQPPSELTGTAAHEAAHSLGIMRERDANVISCYLLISSDDDYLRYCGYYNYYGYLLNALALNYEKNEYAAVYPSYLVLKEADYQAKFWASQKSFLDEVGDFFNSLYLKMSGVKEGTANYYSHTISGDEYVQGDRTFVKVEYNEFQRAFLRVYYDSLE